MAEAWPDVLKPQELTISCVYNSRAFTSSLSNAQQVVSYPGAFWMCSVQFDVLSRYEERQLTALTGRLRGMSGTVNVPEMTRKRADHIGDVVVTLAQANAFAITLSGITVEGKAFDAGDRITISGQMYEITQDSNAAGGSAVVYVNKRVRSNIAPGTPVEYRNPYCEMRLTGDRVNVNVKPVVGSASLEFREAF